MPHKHVNVMGTPYQDDYDEDVEEDFSSSEEETIDSEDTTSSEEHIGSEEFSSSEEEKIRSKPKRGASTIDFDEDDMDDPSLSLNQENQWQRIRIACRKSYTIEGKEADSEGDGSVISFKLDEEHPIAPWDKLGDAYKINSESILGSVRLVQCESTLPATVAYTASMVDPSDSSERVTPNLVISNISKAVSGVLNRGQSLSYSDEPITLIEAPPLMKATFLSKIDTPWTHEEIKAGMQPEIGRPEFYRVHKTNPVFLSYLLTMQHYVEKKGLAFNALEHVEPSGKECFLIPAEQAEKRYNEIVADSKKNTTASFFHKNFRMDFVRAWTDGHSEESCASNIGDSTELFDNVSEDSIPHMKNTVHSISFEIQADFFTGTLGKKV